MALEVLGLLPDQFWNLTPSELFHMAEGRRKRERAELEKLAIQTCWIVNQSGWRSGKPLRINELIKPEIEVEESKENIKKMLDEMAWQHKQKFWTLIGDKYIKKEGN